MLTNTHTHTNENSDITIRAATPADTDALVRVAGRDAGELPQGPMLVAEVAGDVRAAIDLHDGMVIADPFHRTVELVEMLRIRSGSVGHARSGALGQPSGWRIVGLRLAAASSRRRTGVV